MANSVWVTTDNRRRRGLVAAQPEPAHAQIQHAPDNGIELLSVGTGYAERAHTLLREQTHPIELPAIGQHGKKPRCATRVHNTASTWDTCPAHIRPAKYLLNHPHLRGNGNWDECLRRQPRRSGSGPRYVGELGYPGLHRVRNPQP